VREAARACCATWNRTAVDCSERVPTIRFSSVPPAQHRPFRGIRKSTTTSPRESAGTSAFPRRSDLATGLSACLSRLHRCFDQRPSVRDEPRRSCVPPTAPSRWEASAPASVLLVQPQVSRRRVQVADRDSNFLPRPKRRTLTGLAPHVGVLFQSCTQHASFDSQNQ